MLKKFFNLWRTKLACGIFVVYTLFWLYIQSFQPNPSKLIINLFSDSYWIMAFLGAIWGLNIAQEWGGFKSAIGKAVLMFSFGLFAQAFGQISYSYMNDFLKIEIPYPSVGDIGYFGSVIFYIFSTAFLAKASGIKFSLKSFFGKIQAIFIPMVLLGYTYFLFLRDYTFDFTKPLTIILDFGYPLGQSLYISITLLTFLLTRKLLGGLLRSKIVLIFFALLLQYLADFNFLFQNSRGTWTYAGYGDYLYFLAYFIMVIALLQLSSVYYQIKKL